MENMDRSVERIGPPDPFEWDLDRGRDQVVVLRGIPWEQYVAISRARGRARQPLLAYLDGELEIVTVSFRHEFVKKLTARLVEAFAEETGVALNGFGNATLREKAKKAGAEPDEWYAIGQKKSGPDLVIEIVHTSGGIDKLEVYRRLAAQEVWFWIDGRFWLYHRTNGAFREIARSALLPQLDLERLERIIASTSESEQTEAVRAYRQSLRPNR
jgi:Uma2 family endonuclease